MHKNWQRNIKLFLSSQAISLFGSSLVQYAIMWHITLKTQSGVMMMVSILCGFLPMFFLSPFAGVWADRYNRKILIILSDCSIAFVTLVAAILLLQGYGALWILFIILGVRAFGTAVQAPAVAAYIPQLVPEESLTRVNAINGSMQSVVMLLSPMLGGALLTIAPLEMVFFVDVVTAVAAVLILLLFLHVPAHAKAMAAQTVSYMSDMLEGFSYVKNHQAIRTLFVFCGIYYVLITPMAFLTPLQVTRSFGDDVWRLTAIEITFSAGMMLGGFIMAAWGGLRNKLHSLVLSNIVVAGCAVALGIVPVFWIYLVLMVVIGIAVPVFSVPFTVMLQQKSEEGFRGRVFGAWGTIASAAMPLAMLFYGPVADHVRVEWLLIAAGILVFALTFFMLGNKELLAAGEPLPAAATQP